MFGGLYFGEGFFGDLPNNTAAAVAYAVNMNPLTMSVIRSFTASPLAYAASLTNATLMMESPGNWHIIVNGNEIGVQLDGSGSVRDVLKVPPTATFNVRGTPPAKGNFVKISISGIVKPIFRGTVQAVVQLYNEDPHNALYQITCNGAVLLNRRRPYAVYVNVSASTVAANLIDNWTTGFTHVGIQASLPPISISFDGSQDVFTCLKAAATAGGCILYFDQDDLHFFQTETPAEVPTTITDNTKYLINDPPITGSSDSSSIATRVLVTGASSSLLSALISGETLLPVADATIFDVTGGTLLLDDVRKAYTAVNASATGSITGPGVSPSVAPTTQPLSGTDLPAGTYRYSYTWKTAAGETQEGPSAQQVLGDLAVPTFSVTPWANFQGPTNYAPGDSVEYLCRLTFAPTGLPSFANESDDSAILGPFIPTAGAFGAASSFIITPLTWGTLPQGSGGVQVFFNVYRRVNGGAWNQTRQTDINTPVVDDSAHTFASPHVKGASNKSVRSSQVQAIAIGPTGVTQRKLYRTKVGVTSPRQLDQTIADNTTTTAPNDTILDASLGANAPSSDTSGLVGPTGQINAGSATILLAGAAAFSSAGGWAIVGSQLIRYTGITGNTLTGIPASGPGAILATITYNTVVLTASFVTLSSGIGAATIAGDHVNIFLQVDDAGAQTALGAVLLDASGNPTDGVVEYPINDTSLNSTLAMQRAANARLTLYHAALQTMQYSTRDPFTRAGRLVHINLTTEGYLGDFMLQDVNIIMEDLTYTFPRRTVTAANVWLTVEDLLLRIK